MTHNACLHDTFVIYSITCTSGCNYSFMYCWWWMQRAPETCRVISQ